MFTDKVIIVTGAAGNVGSAVTRLLASRGAKVAAVDTLGPPLAAVMADVGKSQPASADTGSRSHRPNRL